MRTPLPPVITKEPCDPCREQLRKLQEMFDALNIEHKKHRVYLGICVRRLGGFVVIDEEERTSPLTIEEVTDQVMLRTGK